MLAGALWSGWADSLSAQAQDRTISFNRGRASTELQVARGQFITARTATDLGRLVVGDPAIASAVPTTG
jgi:pilus assembly protein CpaC